MRICILISSRNTHMRQVPHSFDRLKEETLNWIVPYASPEFLFPPGALPRMGNFQRRFGKNHHRGAGDCVHASGVERRNQSSNRLSRRCITRSGGCDVVDWQADRIGRHCSRSYRIRFLNVVLMAMMVWLGYVTARAIAPERLELCIGVPLLLAFIPQNVFCAMNNDVLSPVCFSRTFLLCFQWLRANKPSLLLAIVTGAADCIQHI